MHISSLILAHPRPHFATLTLCLPNPVPSRPIARDTNGPCSHTGQWVQSCTVKQYGIFQQIRLVVANSNVSAIQCLLNGLHDNLDSSTLWKAWPIGNSTSVGVGFNIQQLTFSVGYLLSFNGLLPGSNGVQEDNFCTKG